MPPDPRKNAGIGRDDVAGTAKPPAGTPGTADTARVGRRRDRRNPAPTYRPYFTTSRKCADGLWDASSVVCAAAEHALDIPRSS